VRSLRGELARVIAEARIEADEARDGRDLNDSIAAAVTAFLFDSQTGQASRLRWVDDETPAQRATRRQAELPTYYRPIRLAPVRVGGSGPKGAGEIYKDGGHP
jgi:hypothetical protein